MYVDVLIDCAKKNSTAAMITHACNSVQSSLMSLLCVQPITKNDPRPHTANLTDKNTQQDHTKCRLEIYFKMQDSCYAMSLVCTERKLLLRCLQLQRVEYNLGKYFQILQSRKILDNS